jgi:hypothetical protein
MENTFENFTNIFKDEKLRYYIKMIEKDNLFMLYTNNIASFVEYKDELINKILRLDYSVFEKETLKQTFYFNKQKSVEKYKDILFDDKKKYIFRYYPAGIQLTLLFDKENWYICYPYNIIKIGEKYSEPFMTVWEKYISNNTLQNLDKNNCYHFIITKKFQLVNGIPAQEDQIVFLFATTKYTNNYLDFDFPLIFHDKEYTVQSNEELISIVKRLNVSTITHKKLIYGGFIIYKDNEQYVSYTSIFNFIRSHLSNFKNVYWNYIDLYQGNLLYKILPYLNEFNKEIIDCIHKSFKIITKEILNIYHMTRKHKNPEIYKHLTKPYKDVLFEIHKVYINNKSTNDDSSIDTTSISYIDVHSILKSYPLLELLKIFEDRQKIISGMINDSIKVNSIFDSSDSNVITLSHLLSENE